MLIKTLKSLTLVCFLIGGFGIAANLELDAASLELRFDTPNVLSPLVFYKYNEISVTVDSLAPSWDIWIYTNNSPNISGNSGVQRLSSKTYLPLKIATSSTLLDPATLSYNTMLTVFDKMASSKGLILHGEYLNSYFGKIYLYFGADLTGALDGYYRAGVNLKILENPTATMNNILHISGNKIFDGYSREVILKGLGLTNGVYSLLNPADLSASSYALTNSDYATIKASGANSVRFYIQYYWLTPANQTAFFQYMDQQIAFAKNNKLYVILNLHYFGTSAQNKAGQEDGFFTGNPKYDVYAFWEAIAGHYKNESTVAGYDLINETNCNASFTESQMYATYVETIRRIRALGDQHIVMVADPVNKYSDPLNSAVFDVPGAYKLLTDNSVLYEFHWYNPFWFTHQGANWLDFPPKLGTAYPYEEYTNNQYMGGYYSDSYLAQSEGVWTEYVGKWVNLAASANSNGTLIPGLANGNTFLFNLGLSPNKANGDVWFDNIRLYKRPVGDTNPAHITELIVPNGNLELPCYYTGDNYASLARFPRAGSWFTSSDYNPTPNFSWDGTQDYLGGSSGSLKLAAGANWTGGTYAQWSQNFNSSSFGDYYTPGTFYPVEQGYEYQSRAYYRTHNNTEYCIALLYNVTQYQTKITYDASNLASMITGYYSTWAANNNVPLYCGEFGVTNPSLLPNSVAKPANSPADQVHYVSDMLSVLNTNGLNWSYHTYKNYGRRDTFGLYDAPSDTEIINTVKSGY